MNDNSKFKFELEVKKFGIIPNSLFTLVIEKDSSNQNFSIQTKKKKKKK